MITRKKQNTSYDVTICIMMSSTKGSDVMTGSDANIMINRAYVRNGMEPSSTLF